MKITPFLLFCIILIVLVIFTIVSNNYAKQNNKEGFLAYQGTAASNSSISIPQYSPTVTVNKLYDQLFFDNNNGNLIEVVSPADATGKSPDIAGNTITSLIVTNRSGSSNIYKISTPGTEQTIADSLIKTVQNNMYSWLYSSQTTVTDKYNVFYIPWRNSTYVYMINAKPIVATTPSTQVGAWLFSTANTSQQYLYTATNNTIPITGFYADTDPNNGLVLGDTFYDPLKSVYQISHYVKFDLQNANLIIQTGDGSTKQITIYDRSGKPTTQTPISKAGTISNTNKTINNVSFQPFTIVDTAGQNLVIYMPSEKKTVIALISQTSATNKTYTLAKVCRFDYGGIDMGNVTTDFVGDEGETDIIRNGRDGEGEGHHVDNRNRNANSQFWNKDDYMLKTQIIPPVCPSCPACPGSSNICTNCGGAGGSGTLSSNGNSSVIGTEGIAQSGAGVINNTVNTVGKLGEKTIDAAGNVIGGTAIGAGLLASSAVNAAGNVAEGAVNVVGNTIGGVASGAGNLVGGVASGIGNVIGGVASGAGNLVGGLASNAGNNEGQGQGQQLKNGTVPIVLGTQNQYTDQYSYYGQLPTKQPTNFMPVNTSFAAFGK